MSATAKQPLKKALHDNVYITFAPHFLTPARELSRPI
jgi:hypothetical protein